MPPTRKTRRGKRKAGEGEAATSDVTGRYRPSSVAREAHGDHVYCVSINHVSAGLGDVFASVGSHRASVYRLEPDGGMRLLQQYVDDDAEESYFACAWCETRGGDASADPPRPLLAFAGLSGVVRVVDVASERPHRDMRGHGNSVNELRAHPHAPHYLLSASKDASVRLWNVDNGLVLAIFGGTLGHRNEVLSCDFRAFEHPRGVRPDGTREDVVIVSGAMDNQVKVWTTDGYTDRLALGETFLSPEDEGEGEGEGEAAAGEERKKKTSNSFVGDPPRDAGRDRPEGEDAIDPPGGGGGGGGGSDEDLRPPLRVVRRLGDFPTACIQTPCFSSYRVHGNYVDCVRWYGDLILSKSVDQRIRLWCPDAIAFPADGSVAGGFRVVQEMPVKLADIWFLRMSVNQELGLAACGNRAGNVCVWRVGVHPPTLVGANALGHKTLTAAVRQTDVSRDGRTVIAGCDGGEVWRWDFATPNEERRRGEGEGRGGRGGAGGGPEEGGKEGAEDGREGVEVIELE